MDGGSAYQSSIAKIALSGSENPTELVSSLLVYPDSLSIDFEAGKLYWSDYSKPSIEMVNFDGSSRHMLPINRESEKERISEPFSFIMKMRAVILQLLDLVNTPLRGGYGRRRGIITVNAQLSERPVYGGYAIAICG